MTRSWLLRPLALVAVLGVSHVALAEAEEHRLGVSASGVVASAVAAGATTSAPQGALELQYAYGLNNWLSVGGELFFAGGPKVVFDDASLFDPESGQQQSGQLHATMFTGGAAAFARAEAGVDVSKLFYVTHPFIRVGAGLLTRSLVDQQLLDADNGGLVFPPANDFTVHPYAALELGVERRFGAGFAAVLSVGGRYAGDAYAAGEVRLAVAWYWY